MVALKTCKYHVNFQKHTSRREEWFYEGIMEQRHGYIWFSMNERFIPVLYYNTHFPDLMYVPMVSDLSILCIEKPLFSFS